MGVALLILASNRDRRVLMMKRIVEVLGEAYPGIDVKVRIGKGEFGGVWRWERELGCHERITAEALRAINPNWLDYVRGLPLIQVPK